MFDWSLLLARPEETSAAALDAWFARIAEHLLNRSRLVVAGAPHRLTEVECYYHSPSHPDPYAHRDPQQRECGRWYFHRSGRSYRGGSFKGVDLTFGDGTAYAGFLTRGMETPDGILIDGPSLCVDQLLKQTGFATVAELDAASREFEAWNSKSPLQLQRSSNLPRTEIFRSARVGLTMNRAAADSLHGQFIGLPYRFLTEPRRIAKGKPLLAVALHASGIPVEQIGEITGSPLANVCRYVERAGRKD